MRHNINGSLPWVMVEKHARLHVTDGSKPVTAEHHTVVRRYQDERTAQQALLDANLADAMAARRNGPKGLLKAPNRRYIARSEVTYSDIMRNHREREALEAFATRVLAMAAVPA